MTRFTMAVVVVTATLIVPMRQVSAQDAIGGALWGAGVGALSGGIATGRAGGAIEGAIVGGTAGAIIGAQPERRPGYYWLDNVCYRRVRGGYARVSRRYCY